MQRTVLFVADNLGLSGKTKALTDLARGLDPARYRPEVCAFEQEDSPLPELLRDSGINVHHVEYRGGFDLEGFSRFARLVRSIHPAVIHCYNPRPILYAGTAARLVGASVVGSLSAFACQVPDRRYDFLPQQLHTRSLRHVVRNHALARLVGAFTVVSQMLGRRFCDYNRIPLHKMRVVPYGVHVERSRAAASRSEIAGEIRRELGIRPDHVIIGSVGRLVEQKDYPTQLRGFARAASTDPRLHMLVVGEGPLRRDLQQLAVDLGVGQRVTFLGHRSDIPRLLAAFDVFVMTSKFEPYGVALLEAKAAGCSIVATAVNEVSEIVPHGRAGLLFPCGNTAAMATALLRLSSDPLLREQLGSQALRDAYERHSLDAMISTFQSLYDELAPATARP